jgi:hypothetical protein
MRFARFPGQTPITQIAKEKSFSILVLGSFQRSHVPLNFARKKPLVAARNTEVLKPL